MAQAANRIYDQSKESQESILTSMVNGEDDIFNSIQKAIITHREEMKTVKQMPHPYNNRSPNFECCIKYEDKEAMSESRRITLMAVLNEPQNEYHVVAENRPPYGIMLRFIAKTPTF